MLHIILWFTICATTVAFIVIALTGSSGTTRWALLSLIVDVSSLIILVISRAGRLRLASILYVVFSSVIVLGFALSGGGVNAPILFMFIIIVFAAGLLLGTRAGILTAVFGSLCAVGLSFAGHYKLLDPVTYQHNYLSLWTTFTVLLALTVGLQIVAAGTIQKSLKVAQLELAERHKTEALLRQSEAKYRGMVETANEGVVVLDTNARMTLVNQQMATMVGYTSEELVGKDFRSILSEEELAYHQAQMLKRSHGESAVYERCFRKKDGGKMWALISAKATTDADGCYSGSFGMLTEITARKQSEEERESLLAQVIAARNEVARSKDTLDQVMQRVSDGIVAFDRDFNYTYVNTHGGELLGRKAEELVGKNYWTEFPEARGTPFANAYLQAMESQQPVVFEEFYAPWNRWFANQIYPSQEGLTIFFTEVTERKRAEAAFHESEARFRSFIEQSSEGMVLIDENGQIIEWNSAQENISGITRAEVLGCPYWDIQHRTLPEELKAKYQPEYFQAGLQNALRTGILPAQVSSREAVIQTANGQNKPIFQVSFPIRTDKGYRIGAVVRDITERKAAEQALMEGEARLRAIVQTANDAVVTMNKDRVIVDWNAAAEIIFGYPSAEALGMSISQIVPKQMRNRQSTGIASALAGERQVDGKMMEVVGLSKDGREFPIEMTLAEWKTQAGMFFTAIIRDVSERKRREIEMQAISTLSAAMRSVPSRADILLVIVEQLSSLLQCEAISAEIIDPVTGDAVVEAAYGIWEPFVNLRQAAGTGLNRIIQETRKPYYTNNVEEDANQFAPGFIGDKLQAVAGVPLYTQDSLVGYLWMGRIKAIAEPEVRLLAAVADIAANAIHRATLHEQTEKDAAELALAYDTTLEGWAQALEMRDQETEGHARRVVKMTVDLASAMGVAGANLVHVRRGALLHDVGKMGIPDTILLKPGTLNDREWEIMRRHPEYAYQFMRQIDYLNQAIDIPYCHHEKWDGTGYPRGLQGEDIPLLARIFSVIDVWDALTSDRTYRKAWSAEQAKRYIAEQSGKHFDPRVVAVFLENTSMFQPAG
jgi:PAS domain S-box-containing protein